MYWYISFLRPPPVSAEVGSSITITPQVANDLRTEVRHETTEIHHYWRRSEPTPYFTRAVHLTSFAPPESTYRPLSIPLPAQAQIGEKWQLCLFTPSPSTPPSHGSPPGWQDILDLTGSSSKCIPLSVYSEGIEITRPNPAASGGVTKGIGTTGKAKGKSKERADDREKSGKKGKERDDGVKQTRIIREWGTPGGGTLRLVEQTSFDLDKKVWDSGLALSSWLCRRLCSPVSESLLTPAEALTGPVLDLLRKPKESFNILELGSGTGLVSIALAAILTEASAGWGRIVATDLDSATELMEENMSINRPAEVTQIEKTGPTLSAAVLDWDQPLPAWIARSDGEEASWPDLIIAADVTYNTASFPSLVRTLKALLSPPNTTRSTNLLLAYKQRDPGERELWDMLRRDGIEMTLVETVGGAEEDGAVEVWITATC